MLGINFSVKWLHLSTWFWIYFTLFIHHVEIFRNGKPILLINILMLPILQRNKNDLLFQLYGYQTNDSKVVKITILCTLWYAYKKIENNKWILKINVINYYSKTHDVKKHHQWFKEEIYIFHCICFILGIIDNTYLYLFFYLFNYLCSCLVFIYYFPLWYCFKLVCFYFFVFILHSYLESETLLVYYLCYLLLICLCYLSHTYWFFFLGYAS